MKIKQRNTAIQSYHEVLDSLPGRRKEVFQALRVLNKACNLDIAQHLGIPINRITPRTNELVGLGVVCEFRRAVCPETNKRVIYWKIKDNFEYDESGQGKIL